jgi:cysteine desulfurase
MALSTGEFTSPPSRDRAPKPGDVKSPLQQIDHGYRVTYLRVDHESLLKLADLETAITDQTAVVSLMWANNETGVLYHCDAVQAAGKVEIDVQKAPADYLSLTGHKFHAPKGIGALYVRRKAPFAPLIYGGHQEP